jgi:amino acid adenylation domain-containing protein
LTTGVQALSLASGFLRSAERFPERPALEVAGTVLTYEELLRRATAIASTLTAHDRRTGPALTAVFGSRSATTFASVLGVLLSGHGYVPLNPRFPPLRNREMLERAGCAAVVVDPASAAAAAELFAGFPEPLLLVLPDGREPHLDGRLAPHRVVGTEDRGGDLALAEPAPEDPAYLLFTSGSTGKPKGVLVTHGNVRAFLDAVDDRYDLSENDRLSQLFDLTFDLSVFDLFAAWEHGACVCCPAPSQLLRPSDLVRESALTVWFSVPSVAMFLQRLGALRSGVFPDLRLSLFCGEALPAELAAAWAAAAPHSVVENLYGPTEATVACTGHRWEGSPKEAASGLVPIGKAFGETVTRVVDESLRDVPPGETGQLLLSGPQVVKGYWADEAATAQSFVQVENAGNSYLTGDRVVQAAPGDPLRYVGRVDSQIKVLGHRVELEEVEAVLRAECSAEVLAVGWPRTASGAAGIVAFIADPSVDKVALLRRVSARLPDYMIPRELRLVEGLPLNANGKRDRNALVTLLEAEL